MNERTPSMAAGASGVGGLLAAPVVIMVSEQQQYPAVYHSDGLGSTPALIEAAGVLTNWAQPDGLGIVARQPARARRRVRVRAGGATPRPRTRNR